MEPNYSAFEERKNKFMRPTYQDPLEKSEQFAISLRQKKKQQIIQANRGLAKRVPDNTKQLHRETNSTQLQDKRINELVKSLRKHQNDRVATQNLLEAIMLKLSSITNEDQLEEQANKLMRMDLVSDLHDYLVEFPGLVIQILVQISANINIHTSLDIISKHQEKKQSLLELVYSYIQNQSQQDNQELDVSIRKNIYLLIGNIAMEGISPRDEVLKLPQLIPTIMSSDLQDPHLTEVVLWALQCILRDDFPAINKQNLKEVYRLCVQFQKSVDLFSLSENDLGHLLQVMTYLSQNSKSVCRKMIHEFNIYLIQILANIQILQPICQDQTLTIWVNLTCNARMSQLIALVEKRLFVDYIITIMTSPNYQDIDIQMRCYMILQNLFGSQKHIIHSLITEWDYIRIQLFVSPFEDQIPQKTQNYQLKILKNFFALASAEEVALYTDQYGLASQLNQLLDSFVANKSQQPKKIFIVLEVIKVCLTREDTNHIFKVLFCPMAQQLNENLDIIIEMHQRIKKLFVLAIDVKEKYLKPLISDGDPDGLHSDNDDGEAFLI